MEQPVILFASDSIRRPPASHQPPAYETRPSTAGNHGMLRNEDAADRKRRRDRVAQQNLRSRRLQYTQDLEERVKWCKETHGSGEEAKSIECDRLWDKIRQLEKEITQLRERQNQLLPLMSTMQSVLAGTGLPKEIGDDPIKSERPDDADHGDGDNNDNHRTHSDECIGSLDGPMSSSASELSASYLSVQHSLSSSPSDLTDGLHEPASSSLSSASAMFRSASDVSHSPQCYFGHPSHLPQDQPLPQNAPIVPVTLPMRTGSENGHSQPWPSALSTPQDRATIMPFNSQVPAYPGGLFSPPNAMLDSRVWNFMDLWTDGTPMEQSTVGGMNAPSNVLTQVPTATCGMLPADAPVSQVHLQQPQLQRQGLPQWARLPRRVPTVADHAYQPWDRDMDAIINGTDDVSPLDLVYGSKTNYLANEIHITVKHFFPGNVERFCMGLLLHDFIKWRTCPTPARYDRLPGFFKPLQEQFDIPHPGAIDVILWKDIRINAMKTYMRCKYDADKMMRKYCACLRLRWPRDRSMILPAVEIVGTEQAQTTTHSHVVNPVLYARYNDVSKWGLTSDFARAYPELLEGVDWGRICVDGR